MKIGFINELAQANEYALRREQEYQEAIAGEGAKVALCEIHSPGWQDKLLAIQQEVDFFYWHAANHGKYVAEKVLKPLKWMEENLAKPVYPGLLQYASYDDKTAQTKIFDRLGLATPDTFYTRDKGEAVEYARSSAYPFVLKDPHSAGGLGVFLLNDQETALDIINAIFSNVGYASIHKQFYAQEFIDGTDGSLRVITLKNTVNCAYWRQSPGDWKHSVAAKGSTVSEESLPSDILDKCTDASLKMGYDWMSYDIIKDKDKYYFLEVSVNFDVEGARKLGHYPRRDIIKFLMQRHKKD